MTSAKELVDASGQTPSVPKLARETVAAVLSYHPAGAGYSQEDELDKTPADAVIHLAGEAGRALASELGIDLAALLIARESGYDLNPIQIYAIRKE